MLRKISFIAALIIMLGATKTFAQTVYTPEKRSAERTTIFNALRLPIEGKLKQKIQFAAETFNVQGNWAFIFGNVQNPAGGRPDYSKTEYQEAIKEGMFDDNFQALLKKQGGKWRVVKYQLGCTDVCWIPWANDYKAPKKVFPNYGQ